MASSGSSRSSPITVNVNLAFNERVLPCEKEQGDFTDLHGSKQRVAALDERILFLETDLNDEKREKNVTVTRLEERIRSLQKELKDETCAKEQEEKRGNQKNEQARCFSGMTLYCSSNSSARCFHYKKACAGHPSNLRTLEPCVTCVRY